MSGWGRGPWTHKPTFVVPRFSPELPFLSLMFISSACSWIASIAYPGSRWVKPSCLFLLLHWGACGILVHRTAVEPTPPALEAQNLNHWTTGGPLVWPSLWSVMIRAWAVLINSNRMILGKLLNLSETSFLFTKVRVMAASYCEDQMSQFLWRAQTVPGMGVVFLICLWNWWFSASALAPPRKEPLNDIIIDCKRL